MGPFIGTLSKGDVYPGQADMFSPAPDNETTDEKSSATAFEGVTGKALRPSMWFVGMVVLLVILYAVHGE